MARGSSRLPPKAVILAAGMGSRMSCDEPKSTLNLGSFSRSDATPVSFLARQVKLLRLAGVEETAVVVGHRKETVFETLKGLDVRFVENRSPDISLSGSLHSFQFAILDAFRPLDGKSGLLLMDADIAYEYELLERVLRSVSERSRAFAYARTGEDSEEVRIFGKNAVPALIGKGLKGKITEGLECFGEATGMVAFAPGDHELVKEAVNWLVGNPKMPEGSDEHRGFGASKRKTEHEELTQLMCSLNRMECSILPPELKFMEVDFGEEYAFCKKTFYPEILERDREKYPRFF